MTYHWPSVRFNNAPHLFACGMVWPILAGLNAFCRLSALLSSLTTMDTKHGRATSPCIKMVSLQKVLRPSGCDGILDIETEVEVIAVIVREDWTKPIAGMPRVAAEVIPRPTTAR